jgi:Sulfatase-modifying factor enzyme 1
MPTRRMRHFPSLVLLLGVGLLPACAVSFDGYTLKRQSEAGATGGAAGTSGDAGGHDATAGSGGVTATGGNSGTGGTGAAGSGGTGATGGAAGSGGTGATGGAAGNGGTGATGGAAGSGGTGGSPTDCQLGLPGPGLIKIAKAGSFFCIDRTEVTNKQYSDFLASGPSVQASNQPPACSWNSSYQPQTSSPCNATLFDTQDYPTNPITCVDWCDAHAYCAWAGKHLCGKIGGGTNSPSDYADASKSEWFDACSDGGTLLYPYGNQFKSLYCDTIDYPTSGTVPGASLANCEGGYPGLYDMSGNAAEWEDSCDGNVGSADHCAERGGSYLDYNSGQGNYSASCNSSQSATPNASPRLDRRNAAMPTLGFRCCWDP